MATAKFFAAVKPQILPFYSQPGNDTFETFSDMPGFAVQCGPSFLEIEQELER